jgi:hypothetical protein
MGKSKNKEIKTIKATNEQLETEVLNPIITAGIVTKDQPKKLNDDEIKRLKIRKKLELEIVKHFDKTTITRKECWFLMDSDWLNAWSAFVSSTEEENEDNIPGPVSSRKLHDENGKILPNLKARIDYRGVPPLVFYILVKLHGKDQSPELPRYSIDIYGPPVDVAHLAKVQYLAQV